MPLTNAEETAPVARAACGRNTGSALREGRRAEAFTAERWRAAVATLRELQESYQTWRDNLPESLEDSATAELLDRSSRSTSTRLDIELPKGFGRD